MTRSGDWRLEMESAAWGECWGGSGFVPNPPPNFTSHPKFQVPSSCDVNVDEEIGVQRMVFES